MTERNDPKQVEAAFAGILILTLLDELEGIERVATRRGPGGRLTLAILIDRDLYETDVAGASLTLHADNALAAMRPGARQAYLGNLIESAKLELSRLRGQRFTNGRGHDAQG